MKNLTLKTAGLLILALFSTQGLANSPWATAETSDRPATVVDEPEQAEPATTQFEAGRPGMKTESPQAAAPQTKTETIKQGDVLDLNNTTTVASVKSLDFPRRGMTTDKVQNELGRPNEIVPAIGQPPISRWIYDDRTVYFEYSSVIHVVAK